MKPGTDPAERPPPCFECGEPVRTEWRDHAFTYGADKAATELTARIPVEVCVSCGAGSLGPEAERLMHEAVCAHHGVLTPQEVRSVRKRHGLSQAEFAEISGLGTASLQRWENGILIQNRANDRYLRLLESEDNLRALKNLDTKFTASPGRWRPVFPTLEERDEVDAARRDEDAFQFRADVRTDA